MVLEPILNSLLENHLNFGHHPSLIAASLGLGCLDCILEGFVCLTSSRDMTKMAHTHSWSVNDSMTSPKSWMYQSDWVIQSYVIKAGSYT